MDGQRRLPENVSFAEWKAKAAPNRPRFVLVFMIVHVMVFTFGMMNYGLTVSLVDDIIAG
jgi:hypothetical protein